MQHKEFYPKTNVIDIMTVDEYIKIAITKKFIYAFSTIDNKVYKTQKTETLAQKYVDCMNSFGVEKYENLHREIRNIHQQKQFIN